MPDAIVDKLRFPPLEGNFTYVFTDIEGSSVLTESMEKETGPGAYEAHRDEHRERLFRHAAAHHGWEAHRAGDGHFFVFLKASDALTAVVGFQREMRVKPKLAPVAGAVRPIVVRIGMHTCRGERIAEKTVMEGREVYEFPGSDTNFAARVASIASAEQILCSNSFIDAVWGYQYSARFKHPEPVDEEAPVVPVADLALRCWPGRRLKSFDGPNQIFEILYDSQSRKDRREPGTRFFPEFYTREANRYIERQSDQNAVYTALGFDTPAARQHDGGIALILAEGGMGKTRLAVTCAVRSAGSFADGVYFVSLAMESSEAAAGKGDAAFLAARLLTAIPAEKRKVLGLMQAAGQPAPELGEILAVLRRSKLDLLLVLDNFESVQAEVSEKVLRVLSEAVVHLLITSRIDPSVNGVGNAVWLNDGMEPTQAYDLARTRIQQKTRADWQPTAAEDVHLHEILRLAGIPSVDDVNRTSGVIPLALELAIAHYPGLHLSRIAQNLHDSPLGMVLASSASLDDIIAFKRHHSVTNTLEWSYGLLGENAKRAFAASGLFATSFSAEALKAIADVSDSHIQALVSNSMLRPTNDDRYTLHGLTRAYARKRLEGGTCVTNITAKGDEVIARYDSVTEAVSAKQRFVDWFVKCLRQQYKGRELNLDNADCRAALRLEKENITEAAAVFCHLRTNEEFYTFGQFGRFLDRDGLWSEQIRLYRQLIAHSMALDDRDTLAWIGVEYASVLANQGKWDDAIAAYDQSLEIQREIGDRQGEAASLHGKANVLNNQGKWDDAVAAYDQSLEIKREIGDRQGEAASLHGKANVLYNQGKWDDAIAAYDQCLKIEREIGARQGEAASLHGKANVFVKQGKWDDAIAAYDQSLEIEREIGARQGEAASLHGKANVLNNQGKWDDAVAAYDQSLEIYRQIGDRQGEAASLHGKANVLVNQGEWDYAIAAYDQSLEIKREIGDRQGEAASLHGKANVLNNQGKWDDAIAAYDQCLEITQRIGDRQGEATTMAAVAGSLHRQGRSDDAIRNLQHAAELLTKLGDLVSASICMRNRAVFLYEIGRRQEAVASALQAIQLVAGTQDEQGKQSAAKLLADLTA